MNTFNPGDVIAIKVSSERGIVLTQSDNKYLVRRQVETKEGAQYVENSFYEFEIENPAEHLNRIVDEQIQQAVCRQKVEDGVAALQSSAKPAARSFAN